MRNMAPGPMVDKVIAELPARQRRAIARRAYELIAEEMSLRELRRSLALTQVQVGLALRKRQHEISRIEQRGDMLLSTLDALIRSMGGELEIICRLKKRPAVRLVVLKEPGNRRGRGKSRARV